MRPLHPHAEQLSVKIFLDHAESLLFLFHGIDTYDAFLLTLAKLPVHLRTGQRGKALDDEHTAHDRVPGQHDLLVLIFFQGIDHF